MSMCRVISCVLGRECLLWPVHSLGKTLLAFDLLHFVLQGQTSLLLQVSLDILLLLSSPLWWKGHLFLVLVLEGLIGHHRTIQLQLLKHYWLEHRLGLLWQWMACLRNEPRSFCGFSDYTQVLHFRLFSDYEGYSISSKRFLPTIVDIMVIWVKFTHFSLLIPKILMFSLAISCLTTFNLPWFMHLTFQVPMQDFSLQHQTLLLSPVTSTTGCCFHFDSISSFFLDSFFHSSPVAY